MTDKNKPTLTAADFAVIADTLNGSRKIADGGLIFTFTEQTRKDCWIRVTQFMASFNMTPNLPAIVAEVEAVRKVKDAAKNR